MKSNASCPDPSEIWVNSASGNTTALGISPVTWAIALVEAAGWGSYGVLVEDRNIVLFGIVSGTASMMVLASVDRSGPPARRRRRGSPLINVAPPR